MESIQDRLQHHLGDRYVIERELGRGGMATVYLARDLKHDREVAIKVLHPELGASIGVDRFEREIKLAGRLQHPHILGLYDSGEAAAGLLFFVMPFVKGESLRDRLEREGQLPIDDAVQITLEVADALGYAHGLGIVHRDIKPENVLLSNGHALVADFGIAKAATEAGAQKLTQTGMAVGTPVYMSPEQAMGEHVTATADIYSLGCMLYEMLSGEPPFTGKTAHAILARHSMESVPSIRIVRATVPEEIEDAIFAAMAKTPADRPQTAAKFTEILGLPAGSTATRRAALRHTASRRVPTQANRSLDLDSPPIWRRPWVLGLVGGLAIAIGWTSWRLTAGAAPPRSAVAASAAIRKVAVLYFESPKDDPALAAAADGLTEALITALGQVRALTVVSRNGVAPFRDGTASLDSVSRALGSGTLIQGTLEPDGADRIRISTRLYDAAGTDLRRRGVVVVARRELFSAAGSVATQVAQTLRGLIGDEVQLATSQSGTKNLAAWTLLNQAERTRKEAERAASQPTRARELLTRADDFLTQAEAADPDWIDPLILRGEIAAQRALLLGDQADATGALGRGLELAGQAVSRDPTNARAIALLGTLRFTDWRTARIADPATRMVLLDSAKSNLETATRIDPTLASAFAHLSFVYYADKRVDIAKALRAAQEAYEADAYLSTADLILSRLFWASYDTYQFSDATKWCDEGRRRFPADPRFVECRLWMMLAPDVVPVIDSSWRLAAVIDSLTPVAGRPFASRLGRMIVGGVIGRISKGASGDLKRRLADSADRVLVGARADRETDPDLELVGYEAIMRTQMGDAEQAIALLGRYVAANPDHSFEVGGNVHWWWQDLKTNPAFQAVMARR